jgi:stalled ribosome rescue protein Dom34
MSEKIKKQFGVWINSNHAIVVGRKPDGDGKFEVLGKETSEESHSNSNENTGNNAERGAQLKLFKNITAHMQNVDELHITGTGVAQEQFMHYLSETPQYKNTVTINSTSNEMSSESLVEFITGKFK